MVGAISKGFIHSHVKTGKESICRHGQAESRAQRPVLVKTPVENVWQIPPLHHSHPMLGPAIDFKPRNNENGHFSWVPFHVSDCPLPTHPFYTQTDTTVKYLIKEFILRPKYLMPLQVLKTLMETALKEILEEARGPREQLRKCYLDWEQSFWSLWSPTTWTVTINNGDGASCPHGHTCWCCLPLNDSFLPITREARIKSIPSSPRFCTTLRRGFAYTLFWQFFNLGKMKSLLA